MAAPPLARRPTRVLLADDSEGLRLLVRSWLSSEDDLEVVAEATNGAEAVALADAHRPDVVVLDVAMPVMDGLEALTELQRRFPDLPVVMHSGFAEGQVARQAIARGARAFVEKSGDLDPLVEALRAAATVPAPRSAPPEPDAAPPVPQPPAAVEQPPAPPPVRTPSRAPAALAAVALLALAVGGPALGEAGTPALLLLVVPVVLLALRSGQRGGLLGATAATAAAGGWALAVPGVSAVHVLACATACGTVGLALGGTVDGRRRDAERHCAVEAALAASRPATDGPADASARPGRPAA